MSKKSRPGAVTAVRPGTKLPPIAPVPTVNAAPKGKPVNPAWQVLQYMASLKLTVVLLIIGMGLVFFGTLAQVENGVWTVVDRYFRSLFVWIPFQIFAHPTVKVPGGFPYPGGWLIGSLLLINLISAHIVRFKLSWTKIGVWLIHIGMIVMMLGEFLTGVAAVEYKMIIEEGKPSSTLIDNRRMELAFIDVTDPNTDKVAAIPGSRLKKGRKISDPNLPVDVEVLAYYANSAEKKDGLDSKNLATAGIGQRNHVVEKPEVSGVDTEQEETRPCMSA